MENNVEHREGRTHGGPELQPPGSSKPSPKLPSPSRAPLYSPSASRPVPPSGRPHPREQGSRLRRLARSSALRGRLRLPPPSCPATRRPERLADGQLPRAGAPPPGRLSPPLRHPRPTPSWPAA
ncbi:uncharacterized protein [Miscanthus floridulus]|uniref:uncharacterized protein n=1 Tax=Miscanthus floridulus TaxID=154761 RepID=UPI0034584904